MNVQAGGAAILCGILLCLVCLLAYQLIATQPVSKCAPAPSNSERVWIEPLALGPAATSWEVIPFSFVPVEIHWALS